MTEKEEKIIKRIKKMLSLSKKNNNKEEAESAFLKAQQLMKRYKIEIAEDDEIEFLFLLWRSDLNFEENLYTLYKWRADLNFEENLKEKEMYEEIQKDIYGKSEYKYRKEGSEFYIIALFMASLLYFFRESVSKAFGINSAEAEIILRILLVITGILVFILMIVERIHREKNFNKELKEAIELELKAMDLYEEFKDELYLLK